jgi:poly-gamma-glutamate synthesis protein (capsule biosynthesis protein)
MYKITILGDIMFQNDMLGQKYDLFFNNVKKFLINSDLVIANLETPVKNNVNKGDIRKYQFAAPTKFVETLKKNNISLLSTANNHCLDNEKKGIIETLDILDKVKLEHVGTYKSKEEKRYIIKEIEGMKVAIVSYTYGTNAFANNIYINDTDQFHICMLQKQELSNILIRRLNNSNSFLCRLIRKILKVFHLAQYNLPVYERNEKSLMPVVDSDIKKLKINENPDYIIMMMHDGGQNNYNPIKRTERRIRHMKRIGIDAIITNHEHMIHKVETLNGRIVTYSLGNFISTNGVLVQPLDKMQEYSIGINIYFNGNKVKYTFTIFKIVYNEKKDNIEVYLLHDLILKERDLEKKEKLINDNNIILNKVFQSNTKYENKLEYDLKV